MDKRFLALVVLGASLSACAGNRYTVGGPDGPPAKPVYQPYVPVPENMDDFLTAAGSNTVLFATDSSYLDSVARETLDRQAAWIMTHRDIPILVEGHCDERASAPYNLELGRRRARSVVAYFVSKGIRAERFTARSYGEGKPVIDNPGDVQINRRAVTVIMNEFATDRPRGDGLPVREGAED